MLFKPQLLYHKYYLRCSRSTTKCEKIYKEKEVKNQLLMGNHIGLWNRIRGFGSVLLVCGSAEHEHDHVYDANKGAT